MTHNLLPLLQFNPPSLEFSIRYDSAWRAHC